MVAPIGAQRADRAILFVAVVDCIGNATAGVQVSTEPSAASTPFYFVTVADSQIPSLTATQTSEFGTFAALNVIPNTAITIRATVTENALSLPPVTVVTRAGGGTSVLLRAAPH